MPDETQFERGLKTLQNLLGDAVKPGSIPPDFAQVTVDHLFGNIWNRPGLELRERSMITVAALVVLGRHDELRIHLNGALNAGISRETIQEMMIHLAHYGGWPVGVSGARIAEEVFAERDAKAAK